MHAESRPASAEPEPAVELWFASAELLDAELEPDGEAWRETAPLVDELGIPADELEIPAVELAHALPTEAWNLGTESRSPVRQAIAVAAAFIPLMLTAEPVLAAPPEASIEAPIEGPVAAAPESNTATPQQGWIWDGLRDRQVVLSLADGASFRGTVLSATEGVLVCARESDGLVVVVELAQITAVHVEGLPGAPGQPRPQNGQGSIVFGSIATAVGGALAVATVAMASSCASSSYYGYAYLCPYYTVPLGVVGVVNLAVGIPLLATGLRKRAALREKTAPEMSAFVLPGRTGVMGGVGIRF
jgi:hypothetical protein